MRVGELGRAELCRFAEPGAAQLRAVAEMLVTVLGALRGCAWLLAGRAGHPRPGGGAWSGSAGRCRSVLPQPGWVQCRVLCRVAEPGVAELRVAVELLVAELGVGELRRLMAFLVLQLLPLDPGGHRKAWHRLPSMRSFVAVL